MNLSQAIRREIADLEAEERALRQTDKVFWTHPQHDREANTKYENRRQQIVSLRKHVTDLYKELMTLH